MLWIVIKVFCTKSIIITKILKRYAESSTQNNKPQIYTQLIQTSKICDNTNFRKK